MTHAELIRSFWKRADERFSPVWFEPVGDNDLTCAFYMPNIRLGCSRHFIRNTSRSQRSIRLSQFSVGGIRTVWCHGFEMLSIPTIRILIPGDTVTFYETNVDNGKTIANPRAHLSVFGEQATTENLADAAAYEVLPLHVPMLVVSERKNETTNGPADWVSLTTLLLPGPRLVSVYL